LLGTVFEHDGVVFDILIHDGAINPFKDDSLSLTDICFSPSKSPIVNR